MLWSQGFLSCDVRIYNPTMSQCLSLACLNNTLMILIKSRSSLARVLPATTEVVEHSNGLWQPACAKLPFDRWRNRDKEPGK